VTTIYVTDYHALPFYTTIVAVHIRIENALPPAHNRTPDLAPTYVAGRNNLHVYVAMNRLFMHVLLKGWIQLLFKA
jgi:hypothetical protein